jgi:hypothetical protein
MKTVFNEHSQAEGHGNVFPDSATAMRSILGLHFPDGTILDVNFGLGTFYKKTDRPVTGVDVRPPAAIICDNKELPFPDDSFDIGVCDPPYKRGSRNVRYTDRYGVAPCTEPRVTKSYFPALTELLRLCRIGIIVKCQDASDGHSFTPRHVIIVNWMRKQTGLFVHDIAIVARRSVPNATTQGTRRFFQQSISYFLVWKWKQKRPFRAMRFEMKKSK